MSIHDLPGGLVLRALPTRSTLYTVMGAITLSNQELLSAARQIIVAIQDVGEEEVLESITLDEHDEKMLHALTGGAGAVVEEAPKKKRGRPKRDAGVTDAVVAEAFASPEPPVPDVIVNLGGNAYAGELKADDGDQAVVTYESDTRAIGTAVVAAAQVEPLGPYDATLQETLVKLFPLGHRATLNGEVGVIVKHFEDSHKCQLDTASAVRIADLREIWDAPAHVPDEDVIARLKAGTYGNDFGLALVGAPMALLAEAQGVARAMGVAEEQVTSMCLALVNGSGFVNTQALAVSLALYFADQKVVEVEARPVIDPPLTPEEIALVRQEVKNAGLTPAQAKDLCLRHFKKESAALLTQGEMQKFLGEVVPTFVEMQGAEDF